MARQTFRRKSSASTTEGRFIASRVQDARRRGYTNREIAAAFDINERTVRKIVAGETSGKRTYRERVTPSEAPNASIVRLDLVVGLDAQGNEIIRTVNAKTPLVRGRTPTPFDVFRLPNMQAVADAEGKRLARQYEAMIAVHTTPRISSLRPIARRNPNKRLVTIRGRVA